MYEKEIENLEHLKTVVGPSQALDTAIALMRAAAPKDEAAFRKTCENIANWAGAEGTTFEQTVAMLQFELAAMRVAGFAKACMRNSVKVGELEAEIHELTSDLADAEHELAALKAAAEPEDEDAEREHCQDAMSEWHPSSSPAVDRLMRERAAARLSGVLDGRRQGREVRRELEQEIDELRRREARYQEEAVELRNQLAKLTSEC
jgi:chromosome segregation ATPase